MGGQRMLQIGDAAPDFCLAGSDGKDHGLQEFAGKTLVLYFYPKDMTPGCTLQAQGYTKYHSDFLSKDAAVVGVSPDSLARHEKFCQKENIPYLLLSDPDSRVAKAYGAFGRKKLYGREYEAVIRSTFVIKDGVIVSAGYGVKPKDDPKNILEKI